MAKRLADYPQEHVTSLIEENRCRFNIRAGELGGSRIHTGEAISWVTTPDSAWPNSAFRPHLTEDNASEVVEFWRSQAASGLAPKRVMFAQPSPAEGLLAKCGLRKVVARAAMFADLSGVADRLPDPSGLRIVEVRASATLSDWVRILGVAMFGRPVSEALFAKTITADDFRLYLGYLDGTPAATSLVFLADGIAGIHQVSTLEEFRGKGLGTKLTIAAAAAARDLGYRDVTLFASEMGESIYRQIGFRECGKIAVYSLE
jgi:ribosomal protein S18 acetylase RimI-like enzyme